LLCVSLARGLSPFALSFARLFRRASSLLFVSLAHGLSPFALSFARLFRHSSSLLFVSLAHGLSPYIRNAENASSCDHIHRFCISDAWLNAIRTLYHKTGKM